ncbi:MAG: hypothetical protein ACRC5V_02785 [Aeromonas sp.]
MQYPFLCAIDALSAHAISFSCPLLILRPADLPRPVYDLALTDDPVAFTQGLLSSMNNTSRQR